jgi:hypothetical protein
LLLDKNIFALPKYPSQGEKAVTIDAGDKAKERARSRCFVDQGFA